MTTQDPNAVLNLCAITTDVQIDGDTVRLILTDGQTTVHLSTCGANADAAVGLNAVADGAGLAWEAFLPVLRRAFPKVGEKG